MRADESESKVMMRVGVVGVGVWRVGEGGQKDESLRDRAELTTGTRRVGITGWTWWLSPSQDQECLTFRQASSSLSLHWLRAILQHPASHSHNFHARAHARSYSHCQYRSSPATHPPTRTTMTTQATYYELYRRSSLASSSILFSANDSLRVQQR